MRSKAGDKQQHCADFMRLSRVPSHYCHLRISEAAENDAADAEAIMIAAQRPEMRFVEPRSEWQQARAVLFRARERLVHQRTELVNALRQLLYYRVTQSRRASSISSASG